MTPGKTLVCPCEDVTEAEVLEAIGDGYADLESLKRYTALATGPCQGKACLVLARRILAEARDVDPADLGTITYRPPTQPVRLGDLAEATPGPPPPEEPEEPEPDDPGGPAEPDAGGPATGTGEQGGEGPGADATGDTAPEPGDRSRGGEGSG